MADTRPPPTPVPYAGREGPKQNGKKALGRNQKLAIWCYAVPYAVAVLPMLASVASGLMSGTVEGDQLVLASIDRLVTFTQVYALVAVASILVVSGAIKGVDAVAGAIGKAKATP